MHFALETKGATLQRFFSFSCAACLDYVVSILFLYNVHGICEDMATRPVPLDAILPLLGLLTKTYLTHAWF